MSFPRDAYPYTNFHELNLGYFIVHFREIFSQWADLYDQMLNWKDATDEELATWKAGMEDDLDQREAALRAELETWKAQTGQDIAGWEDATLAALTAWQTATQAVFEAIRVEAAGSATAAAASAGDAATAKTAAETAQAAAETAAASIASSAAQIATNTADISDLKTHLENVENSIINGDYNFTVEWEDGTIYGGTEEQNSSTRKRTKDFIYFETAKNVSITVPNGKRIIGWFYSQPAYADFINTLTWKTEDFTIDNTNNYYWKFVISDNPEGTTRVNESGFAFAVTQTFGEKIYEELTDFQNTLISTGYNKLNPEECVNSTNINTSGNEQSNANYWTTGFVNIGDFDEIVLPTEQKLRYAFYDSAKTFIEYGTKYNPVPVPNNAEFIRICYSKSIVPFENCNKLSIIGIGQNPSFEHYNLINHDIYSIRDDQYFNVNSGNYSESFIIEINRGNQGNKNMIVSFKGNYIGNTAPTIKFFMPYSATGNFYTSQLYTLGGLIQNYEQQWRIPAFPDNATKFIAQITIPEGTTLYVKHLYNAYDNTICRNVKAYRLNAHLGTPCIYPTDTLLGFNSAAKLGYSCCVTVPKRTSDGIWVCFHDDSNVGTRLRMPDGTTLPSLDATKSISQFTYAELMAFDAGIRSNPFYAGEKVPRLDDFFELCGRTGMSAMLSVHPYPSIAEWAEVKSIAEEKGVLETLNLKFGSLTELENAYNVFGDEVESYTYDVSTETDDAAERLLALGLTVNHAKLGIEYFNSVITSTRVKNALDAGLFVACFIQYGTSTRYKELLDMGVTEITDDNNCSYGLNW